MKKIISLCDFSGTWSQPYVDAGGYEVIRIDLQRDGRDVRLLERMDGVHGILAAPPCTCFAASGARWKRSEADMLQALSVVDACIRIVRKFPAASSRNPSVCRSSKSATPSTAYRRASYTGEEKMFAVAVVSLICFFIFRRFSLAKMYFITFIIVNINIFGRTAGILQACQRMGISLFNDVAMGRFIKIGYDFLFNSITSFIVILICYQIYKKNYLTDKKE